MKLDRDPANGGSIITVPSLSSASEKKMSSHQFPDTVCTPEEMDKTTCSCSALQRPPETDPVSANDIMRVARDGYAYSYQEFVEYYGDRRGAELWREADFHSRRCHSAVNIGAPYLVSVGMGISGTLVDLGKTPVYGDDTVSQLRDRVAEALGLMRGRVRLFRNTIELQDVSYIHDVADATFVLDITAFTMLCKVHPSNYWRYIWWYDGNLTRIGSGFEARERVQFPAPNDININMMPFIIGQKESIPTEYQQYWPMLESCHRSSGEYGTAWKREKGKVGYLTIHESYTPAEQAHRRRGIHTESPGVVMTAGGRFVEAHWGKGGGSEACIGGIFMASTTAGSCRVWNCQIREINKIVGPHGDLEHLREDLNEDEAVTMAPNQLYWITDSTPHESIPLEQGAYRQYFRFVTSSVSVWYEKHSTKNRLGIQPPCKVITHDKFEGPIVAQGISQEQFLPGEASDHKFPPALQPAAAKEEKQEEDPGDLGPISSCGGGKGIGRRGKGPATWQACVPL